VKIDDPEQEEVANKDEESEEGDEGEICLLYSIYAILKVSKFHVLAYFEIYC
jgi:hypothetical protein